MDSKIQRGLAQHLATFQQSIARGAGRLGWKVGFNTKAVQERLGIPYALVAGLTNSTLEDAGRIHDLGGSARVACEAEIAAFLERDVRTTMTDADVASSVEFWAPAIELVEFNRSLDDIEPILAEGIFHRAVRFGGRVKPQANADLAGVTGRVDYSGHTTEFSAQVTGHVPGVLLHLASLLEPFGEKLAAGDVVILGAMNPLTFAAPGTTFVLELSEIGGVRVRFR